jgi:hypothetical protein
VLTQSLDLESKRKQNGAQSRKSFWRRNLVERELFVICLLVFGASMSTIISSQDAIQFALTWSLATTHKVWLDGHVFTGQLYTVQIGAHTYSALPPGLAFFTFAVVSLAQKITPLDPSASGVYIATYFSSIFAAIAVVLFFKVARMFGSEKTAAVLTIVLAFGTGLWIYARIYLPEALATCLSLAVVYCILRSRQLSVLENSSSDGYGYLRKRSSLTVPVLTLFSGILLGLTVFVDNIAIFFIIPIFLYLVLCVWPLSAASKVGSIFSFIFGCLIGFIPTWLYDLASTGNAFVAPYGLPFIGGVMPSNYEFNFANGLYQLLLSPESGVLVFTPFALVSLVGFFFFLRQRRAESLLFFGLYASILVPMTLMASSTYYLHNTIGPGELVIAMPYILLPAIAILGRARQLSIAGALIYVLAVASIVITGLIALTDPVLGPAATLSALGGASPVITINIPLFLHHSFLTWWSFFADSMVYALLILALPLVSLLIYSTVIEFRIRKTSKFPLVSNE